MHAGLFAALAGVVMLAGCAPTQGSADPGPDFIEDARLGERVDRLCFGGSIRGFGEATNRSLVIEASGERYYRIVTAGYCRDLSDAIEIAFSQNSGCLTRADSLTAFGRQPRPGAVRLPHRSCPIADMHRWRPDETSDAAARQAR